MNKPNRREFLKQSALVAGSVLLMPSCFHRASKFRFFTEEEASCVTALCEQIIPHDESPGASDAGVIYYIDRQLSGVFHYNQVTYRSGILKLQAFCQSKYKSSFQELPSEQQIQVMKQMEAKQMGADWNGNDAAGFFNLVLKHTMQGFYGSPIHGGNKDYMSFTMLQLDYPLVIGQNRYQPKRAEQ